MMNCALAVIAAAAAAALTPAQPAARRGIAPVRFSIDDSSGRLLDMSGVDGRRSLSETEFRYHVMSKAGDIDACERDDKVQRRFVSNDVTTVVCSNPRLPGLEIRKCFRIVNGGVRRSLSLLNTSAETRYMSPYSECIFHKPFLGSAYHLGAGYIGPYKPFPKVERPTVVEDYLQSSKGIVLVNPDGRAGCFSHLRVKINDTAVFPWWHSTIGHYREKHDRLWYLPEGYRMCLGTFGLFPGKRVTVDEQFTFFDGNLFTFFDDVFASDPDFKAELASIPPPPAWLRNLAVNFDDRFGTALPWILDMLDEGDVMMHLGPAIGYYSWGDYRMGRGGFPTMHGGFATDGEIKAHVDAFKISPRVHVSVYGIVIAAGYATGVVREHPEWFRRKDRSGADDSLFPGLNLNWQTMFSVPSCRDWMADMMCGFAESLGLDTFYLDETQMTDTIDWERDRITQDDDSVKFWKGLVAKKNACGGKMFFANGSGMPYVDLNYIEECRGTLRPENWRNGSGVLLGVAMMNRLRRGQRTIPLYWQPGNDYVNRILALGWIPRTHLRGAGDIPVIRAAWQCGHAEPADVRYSPDWKSDPHTEIESYAVRRDESRDVLLSFINRAASPTNLVVTVDLSTLGFARGERIVIFRQNLDVARAGGTLPDILSDREIKAGWRDSGSVRGARITEPEVVWTGFASGSTILHAEGLKPGSMEQFLAMAAPLAIFSVDDLPLCGFYTTQRGVRVDGRLVEVAKGKKAEFMLFDGVHDFAGVTANGSPLKTRRVRIGKTSAQLVAVGEGKWRIGWRETARNAHARADIPADSPPRRTAVPPPQRKWHPEIRIDEKVNAKLDGARIVRRLAFASCVEASSRLQENSGMEFAAAKADAGNMTLVAGTTRREGEIEGMSNFAGFEMEGAEALRLRLTADFTNTVTCSVESGHAAPWAMRKEADKVFAGIIVDYRVGGRYGKRVAFPVGLPRGDKCLLGEPRRWGTGREPDSVHPLGNWLDSCVPRDFVLDVRRHAPNGWDGAVIVSLGTSRIQCGRSLRLELLGALRSPAPSGIAAEHRSF